MLKNAEFRSRVSQRASSLLLVIISIYPCLVHATENSGQTLRSVAVTLAEDGGSYYEQVVGGAEKAARDISPQLKFTAVTCKNTAEIQMKQIDEFIRGGVDLIIIQRSYAGDSSPAVRRARQAGVTVVAIDSDVRGGTDALVKPDEKQGGVLAAQYIAQRLADTGGTVAIANGPASAGPIQLRVEGFIGELKKYPRIRIVDNRDTGMSREGTRRVMAQFLADHAGLDAVYGVNDPVAYYCELEALAANRTNLFIVGMEGSPTSTKAMRDPQRLIAASPAEDPFAIAETAVKIGAALRQGGPALTSPVLVPFTELSRRNIGQYHGWSR